jgi:hypothetical protein
VTNSAEPIPPTTAPVWDVPIRYMTPVILQVQSTSRYSWKNWLLPLGQHPFLDRKFNQALVGTLFVTSRTRCRPGYCKLSRAQYLPVPMTPPAEFSSRRKHTLAFNPKSLKHIASSNEASPPVSLSALTLAQVGVIHVHHTCPELRAPLCCAPPWWPRFPPNGSPQRTEEAHYSLLSLV